jgi:solute:Na+ symporter, SSS family
MEPFFILLTILGYFSLLLLISLLTGKRNDNQTFFLGNKQSPWFVVAFGMIGASLSGVTFISVPGWVASSQFSYLQMVLGYLVGYFVIATVLMPLYYRLNLTSIYSYLEQRFGFWSYKTGAFFFLLSRTIGAAFRLYLVANVLQITVFEAWNLPFSVTVIITIALIWLYTFRSGIKTIIWTDTLQTFFMLLAVGITIWLISAEMNLGFLGLYETIRDSEYSQIFFFEDWSDTQHFVKQFLAGAFIAIVMTGLDQDMMQKNLSCKNIREAQKNMFWFSIVLVFVNILFLSLGVLLYQFAALKGITATGDNLYPIVATNGELGIAVGLFFILGLIAAAYSSADSALTALTTSFSVDFLNIEQKAAQQQIKIRQWVHIGFSILLVFVILIFKLINDDSVISALFIAAGYTYGPLLGLYAFGLFTQYAVKDRYVPIIAVLSPLICYIVNFNAEQWFGFQLGFELLIINGFLTFIGLTLVRVKQT